MYHRHSNECYSEASDSAQCGYYPDEIQPVHTSIQDLLADHFGINQRALDQEKQQMLDELREINGRM
jgi:hypothetical protein